MLLSSPRMWRCFRARDLPRSQYRGLLHACGGVSRVDPLTTSSAWVFSTHVEVFPGSRGVPTQAASVFSTHVEVFPLLFSALISRLRLLHACGGVSADFLQDTPDAVVFSHACGGVSDACAGLDAVADGLLHACGGVSEKTGLVEANLSALLHACGGVSTWSAWSELTPRSSPRMWRCFRKNVRAPYTAGSLLHACGGVSEEMPAGKEHKQSSPRMWRCF